MEPSSLEAALNWHRLGKLASPNAESVRHTQAIIDRLTLVEMAAARLDAEVCQILGKALGYPWFKDDPANFPDATEEHGVCVGEHTAETIAAEAAAHIAAWKELAEARGQLLLCYRTGSHDGASRAIERICKARAIIDRH